MGLIWITILVLFIRINEAQDYAQTNFGECMTPDLERSHCIYLNECGPLYSLIQKVPLNDDDKIYLRRSQCGYYQGKVLVCCPRNSSPPQTPQPPVQPVYTTRPPNTNTQRPTSIPERTGGGASLLPQPGVCGTGSQDRIYGGNRTRIDEYPWMALLEYTKPGNRKGYHCGGALINDRYVITASHCVNGNAIPLDWRLTGVRLGEWDLSTDNDCDEDDCSAPVVNAPIESAIPHESYNPNSKSQTHDIALLRLSTPIRYTDWIRPICLPIANNLRSSRFVGASLDVAGWGKTESSASSDIKLKARVNGVDLNQCNNVYNRQNVILQDTQICAGGERGIDSCRGDSGGPLIGYDAQNKVRPHFFLVGIVSFGPTPCGLEGWPGVYTRVGSYVDWIQSNIRN